MERENTIVDREKWKGKTPLSIGRSGKENSRDGATTLKFTTQENLVVHASSLFHEPRYTIRQECL